MPDERTQNLAAVRSALEGFTTTYADIQLTVRRSVTDGGLTAAEWDEIGTETASGDDAIFKFAGMIDHFKNEEWFISGP